MKISYRERIIFSVFIFLMTLFVCFFVIIKPQISNINKSKSTYSELKSRNDQLNNSIATIPSLKKKLNAQSEECKKLYSFFYENTTSDKIDRILYTMASNNKISIDQMNISQPQKITLTSYSSSDQAQDKKASSAQSQVKSDCVTVTLIFQNNSLQNIMNFFDDIDKQQQAISTDSCEIQYNSADKSYKVTTAISFYCSVGQADDTNNSSANQNKK